jgi:aromatic ring-opening dioxygenase catalytic subunit (LigB family)
MSEPLPVFFFGHGNPINALLDNAYTKGWAAAGMKVPRPRAVLAVAYESLGPDAILSVPTPDHYLPLLYVIALRRKGERLGFPVEGMDGGSVSMLAVKIG